jgi:hypothetical protein
MEKLFPTVPAGTTPACFNCSRPTAKPEPVDAAPKRGQWRAYCAACRMFTFFDVER